MKHILFIGGAGFIGSNLLKQFDTDKYLLHVLEPEDANISRLDKAKVTIHRCSLSDVGTIQGILTYFLPRFAKSMLSLVLCFLGYNPKSFYRFIFVGPVGELAETTSLLRMRSRKITESSNLSLSATYFKSYIHSILF